MIYPCNDCGQSGLIAARGLCSGCVEKILRRLETARPEALRNQIIDECAKAINKRTEQLCSDPEVCYQEHDTGATVINSRYSDHVEALDEAEAIVLALKTIPSPLARRPEEKS